MMRFKGSVPFASLNLPAHPVPLPVSPPPRNQAVGGSHSTLQAGIALQPRPNIALQPRSNDNRNVSLPRLQP
jgi:hypothetical protein